MDSYHTLFFPQFPRKSQSENEGNKKCSSVLNVEKNYEQHKNTIVALDADRPQNEKNSEQNS